MHTRIIRFVLIPLIAVVWLSAFATGGSYEPTTALAGAIKKRRLDHRVGTLEILQAVVEVKSGFGTPRLEQQVKP